MENGVSASGGFDATIHVSMVFRLQVGPRLVTSRVITPINGYKWLIIGLTGLITLLIGAP